MKDYPTMNKEYPNPQDILAEDGLFKQLTKAVIERCLETELDTHLGYPKHIRKGNATGKNVESLPLPIAQSRLQY